MLPPIKRIEIVEGDGDAAISLHGIPAETYRALLDALSVLEGRSAAERKTDIQTLRGQMLMALDEYLTGVKI